MNKFLLFMRRFLSIFRFTVLVVAQAHAQVLVFVRVHAQVLVHVQAQTYPDSARVNVQVLLFVLVFLFLFLSRFMFRLGSGYS